eukprot:8400261-Pyramimonas_sp.AAC.1
MQGGGHGRGLPRPPRLLPAPPHPISNVIPLPPADHLTSPPRRLRGARGPAKAAIESSSTQPAMWPWTTKGGAAASSPEWRSWGQDSGGDNGDPTPHAPLLSYPLIPIVRMRG